MNERSANFETLFNISGHNRIFQIADTAFYKYNFFSSG